MTGATKDYAFAQKANWRGWAWNRIAERVRLRRKALVVGLFGAEGLDIPVAVKHGFSANNMISVELDKEAIKKQRENGINAVKGDLAGALVSMVHRRPNVIVADSCSNTMMKKMIPIAGAATLVAQAGGTVVLMVNLMRGREGGEEAKRVAYFRQQTALHKMLETDTGGRIPDVEKNRAAWFLILLAKMTDEAGAAQGVPKDLRVRYFETNWWGQTRPQFASYRSGALVFDSMVLTLPAALPHAIHRPDEHLLRRQRARAMRLGLASRATAASVAAALAFRTRRVPGERPPS